MSLVGLRPPRRKTKLDYFFAKLVQKSKGQRGCRVSLAKFWLSVIPCAVRCTAAPPYPYVSAHGKPQRAQDRRGTVIGAPSPDPDRSRPRRVQDTDPSRLTWVNEAHRCRPRPVLDANQAWPSLVPNADRFRPRALLCTTKSQGMMLVCMYYMGHTTRRDVPFAHHQFLLCSGPIIPAAFVYPSSLRSSNATTVLNASWRGERPHTTAKANGRRGCSLYSPLLRMEASEPCKSLFSPSSGVSSAAPSSKPSSSSPPAPSTASWVSFGACTYTTARSVGVRSSAILPWWGNGGNAWGDLTAHLGAIQ